MEEAVNKYLGLPQFICEGIFNITVTLGAGLIIAFVITFHLKKKNVGDALGRRILKDM